MMSKYMAEKWEREAEWLMAVERERPEEVRVVRNRPMWMSFLPPRARVMVRSRLLPRAMSDGSMVPPQLWYVLRFMTHQRPQEFPASGLPLVAMIVFKGCATAGFMPI